ncbi:low affinity immunoglobulin epsilon Fc receptor-like [Macrobrachium rosenbergii]|uniref:low affinity immunoglobulin epsilon Fc receptor-like n=1 Tax=Macrobrachium rosenbergii TaxID=79674 RepID=UPI0034D4F5F6
MTEAVCRFQATIFEFVLETIWYLMMKITWMFTVVALSAASSKASQLHFEICGNASCPTSDVVEETSTESKRICAAVCLLRFQCLGFCYHGVEEGCRLFNLHLTSATANAVAAPSNMYCARDLDGYARFGRKAYRFFPAAQTLAGAITSCFNDGAYLAMPMDAEENSRLVSLSSASVLWINGTDAPSEGTWVATGTGTPLSYFNWDGPEPNGGTEENCIFMNESGFWIDSGCDIASTYSYICEKTIY